MHIDNITAEKMTLDNDGKAMQISVYEKEIERLNNIINNIKKEYELFSQSDFNTNNCIIFINKIEKELKEGEDND